MKQRNYFQKGIYEVNIEKIDERKQFLKKKLPELVKRCNELDEH